MSQLFSRRSLIGVYKFKHVWTVDDYLWAICMPLCGILVVLSFILLVKLILNFKKVSEQSHVSTKIQNKIKFLSILTSFLSFTCNAIYFTVFPSCVEEICGENPLGHFYFLGTMDSYILSRLSLYFLLCLRLYTSFRKSAFSYPKFVYIILATFVTLSFCGLILFNVAVVIGTYHGVYGVPITAISLYCAMDISLGIMTMVLFVRPLCKLTSFKKQLDDDAHIEKMDEMHFIIVKYIILSLTTLISSVFVGIILAIRFLLGFAHVSQDQLIFSISYLNLMVLFSVIDGFITILCIYMYFKFGDNLYKKLCKTCYKCCLKNEKAKDSKHPMTPSMEMRTRVGSTSTSHNSSGITQSSATPPMTQSGKSETENEP